jgi:hypothetical protein
MPVVDHIYNGDIFRLNVEMLQKKLKGALADGTATQKQHLSSKNSSCQFLSFSSKDK